MAAIAAGASASGGKKQPVLRTAPLPHLVPLARAPGGCSGSGQQFPAVSLELGPYFRTRRAGSAEEPEPVCAAQPPASAAGGRSQKQRGTGASGTVRQSDGVWRPVLPAPAPPETVGSLPSPSVFRGAELQERSRRCRFLNAMLTFFNWKLL